MPECRLCHVKIDKEKDDWIMPSNLQYYHRRCYEAWRAQRPEEDDEWVARIYDFLAHDLKVSYNWHMCEQQRKKFGKTYKINNKGIYFTLKYFYEVKKNSWEKGHGGLGIVPYVFEEAKAYWIAQERQRHGFMKEMEEEIKQREVIRLKRAPKKREKYNLDEI